MVVSLWDFAPCDRMADWELQLPTITREDPPAFTSQEKIKIQNVVSTEFILLSHHCKAEKL